MFLEVFEKSRGSQHISVGIGYLSEAFSRKKMQGEGLLFSGEGCRMRLSPGLGMSPLFTVVDSDVQFADGSKACRCSEGFSLSRHCAFSNGTVLIPSEQIQKTKLLCANQYCMRHMLRVSARLLILLTSSPSNPFLYPG